MKTTILSFIISLSLTLTFSSCQTEEVAPIQSGGRLLNPVKLPVPTSIPPAEVIRTDYSGATKWRITFTNPKYAFRWSYQRFFSISDGTFRTLADLNNSPKATSKADMDFLFGYIRAAGEYNYYLHHASSAPATQFKPASLGLLQLADITANHPDLFQTAFEKSPFEATPFQPYNYSKGGDESTYYENGDIFLFKTDQNPVRYGAIRIVETSQIYQGIGSRIVEVIAQADNNIFQPSN